MGGTIGVESEEGKGSKFTFTLPLELDASSEEGDKPPTISTLSSTTTTTTISSSSISTCPTTMKNLTIPSPHRVLVVDRHEMTKEALCDQIRAWGLDAHCCNNVEEAIPILQHACASNLPFQVAIVERAVVEFFSHEMQRLATSEMPEMKALQVVLLGRVGNSPPSQRMLAELGCCSSFSRPPRQAYLRDALSVAFSGGEKFIRMKPDLTLDMMRTAPKNLRYSSVSHTCGLLSTPAGRRSKSVEMETVVGSPVSEGEFGGVLARSPKILIVVRSCCETDL